MRKLFPITIFLILVLSFTGCLTPVDSSNSETAITAPTTVIETIPTTTTATETIVSPTPTPTPTATATQKPGSATVPPAVYFTVSGKVNATRYFTVADLKSMSTVSASYFSRGKEPAELTTAFVGVRLIDILDAAGLASDAQKVTITAADEYTASFTMRQVRAGYIDETRPGVTLPMIIAYSEDGVAYTGDHPFRLAMGQSIEGDYNRQYWVRIVVSIVVS